MALDALQVPYIHEFSCDVDRQVRKQILPNWSPIKWYDNLLLRDPFKAPDVDLYVAGWPCQPFSGSGSRKGLGDERADVFFGCARFIEVRKP